MATKKAKFAFDLNASVRLALTKEVGQVIGRAEYASGNENSYLVRYEAGDHRQTEVWWNESALQAA
jgi:hypothetical protein